MNENSTIERGSRAIAWLELAFGALLLLIALTPLKNVFAPAISVLSAFFSSNEMEFLVLASFSFGLLLATLLSVLLVIGLVITITYLILSLIAPLRNVLTRNADSFTGFIEKIGGAAYPVLLWLALLAYDVFKAFLASLVTFTVYSFLFKTDLSNAASAIMFFGWLFAIPAFKKLHWPRIRKWLWMSDYRK
ncbi:MAG: hypothetical protein V1834_04375 [Candidatus Micrarchaeota archaeon]